MLKIAEGIANEGLPLDSTPKLVEFITTALQQTQDNTIKHDEKTSLEVLDAGWHRHSIGAAFYGKYFIYANTGAKSIHPGVFIIPVTDQQKEDLRLLLANHQSYEDTFTQIKHNFT